MARGQREAVPRHDPTPIAQTALRVRFWRLFRVLALFAIVVGALSAAIVERSVGALHIHMLVATALGTGFTVLVGGALMMLVFISARSGHDTEAATPPEREND